MNKVGGGRMKGYGGKELGRGHSENVGWALERGGGRRWASTAPKDSASYMEIFGFKVDSPWSQIGTKVNPRRQQPAPLVNCFLDARDSSRDTPPPFRGM